MLVCFVFFFFFFLMLYSTLDYLIPFPVIFSILFDSLSRTKFNLYVLPKERGTRKKFERDLPRSDSNVLSNFRRDVAKAPCIATPSKFPIFAPRINKRKRFTSSRTEVRNKYEASKDTKLKFRINRSSSRLNFKLKVLERVLR